MGDRRLGPEGGFPFGGLPFEFTYTGPVTADTNLTSNLEMVLVDATGGTRTITIQSAVASEGNVVGVANVMAANQITVDTEGDAQFGASGFSRNETDLLGDIETAVVPHGTTFTVVRFGGTRWEPVAGYGAVLAGGT